MKNRTAYQKDPITNKIRNKGSVVVKDNLSAEERQTLRYELETFVCDDEYADGLQRILEGFRNHVCEAEQPAVWVSGINGSGKSHLIKILKTLWTDHTFHEDKATARGLTRLPDNIRELLSEITTLGKREGGLHAASGTLSADAGDNFRSILLGIVFRSVGLSDQYPIAFFELWLKCIFRRSWATESGVSRAVIPEEREHLFWKCEQHEILRRIWSIF